MRKRSSYRPRPILLDTMAHVKTSLTPVSACSEENVVMRLATHTALESVIRGDATSQDIDKLIACSNMSTALARGGKGLDWRQEIRAGADAIEAIQKRYYRWKKVQATDAELDAIRMLVAIHNAQLDDSLVQDLDRAVIRARNKVKEIS